VHLWLGGHALLEHGGAALYDPATHLKLLSAAFDGAPPAELWAGRNDHLGAFFYPPPMALFYAPLGGLAVHLAGTIHAVLSFLGITAAGVVLGRWSRLGAVFTLLVLLTTPALFHNHVLGQNGGWVVVLLALAGLLLVRRHDLPAGLLLGLLLCKPSWLLAVGWVPFVLRRWRTVGGMVAGVGIVAVVSALFTGLGSWYAWLALAPDLAALSRAGDYPLHLQYSLWGLGRRVLGLGTPGDLLGGALSIGIFAATAWRIVRTRAPVAHQLALALCAASLVNPHLHPYDVTGGIFALAVLLAEPRTRRLGLVALLVHHGGQALEGLQGSGLTIAPATVGLLFTWAALWARLDRADHP